MLFAMPTKSSWWAFKFCKRIGDYALSSLNNLFLEINAFRFRSFTEKSSILIWLVFTLQFRTPHFFQIITFSYLHGSGRRCKRLHNLIPHPIMTRPRLRCFLNFIQNILCQLRTAWNFWNFLKSVYLIYHFRPFQESSNCSFSQITILQSFYMQSHFYHLRLLAIWANKRSY